MAYFLASIILLLFGGSGIFILICCGKLSIFNGSYDEGKFYIFSLNKVEQIKSARIIGKLLLLPVLLYTVICETIAMIAMIIFLFFKGLMIYLLNKNESFVKSIAKAFGYGKWLVISSEEKLISYSFMGYQWSKPYVVADIEW